MDDAGATAAGPAERGFALPRGLIVLLGTAALVITIAGLQGIAGLLGPVFLSLVLTLAVVPFTRALRRWGVPGWLAAVAGVLAAVAGVLAVYLILVVLVGSLGYAIATLAVALPDYADQFDALLADVTTALERIGVGQDQIDAAIRQFDLGSVVSVLQDVLGQVAGVASDLLLILLVLLFMGIDALGFGQRLAAVRPQRPELVAALSSFAAGTRKFLLTATLLGLVAAVLDIIALLIIGVPLALVWGLLAFITSYIPNIGFVIGLIPPALLALLEGGWVSMLLVIVVYVVINFVIQTLAQSRIVGAAVGLSAIVTLLALFFWSWVMGPLGALLAIPLTLMAKALLIDVDPRSHWLGTLISAETPKAATPD